MHPKVKAGSAAAAVSGIIVWLLGRYVLHGQVDSAVQAEIYAAVPALLTFAAGYFTPAKHQAQHQLAVNVTAGADAQEAGREIAQAIRDYQQKPPPDPMQRPGT